MPLPSKYDLRLVASIAAGFLHPRKTIDSAEYAKAAITALKLLNACDHAIEADYRERCGFAPEGKHLDWEAAIKEITGIKNVYKALHQYREYLNSREKDELPWDDPKEEERQSRSFLQIIPGPKWTVETRIENFRKHGTSQKFLNWEKKSFAIWKDKSDHAGRSKAGKASAEARAKTKAKNLLRGLDTRLSK